MIFLTLTTLCPWQSLKFFSTTESLIPQNELWRGAHLSCDLSDKATDVREVTKRGHYMKYDLKWSDFRDLNLKHCTKRERNGKIKSVYDSK